MRTLEAEKECLKATPINPSIHRGVLIRSPRRANRFNGFLATPFQAISFDKPFVLLLERLLPMVFLLSRDVRRYLIHVGLRVLSRFKVDPITCSQQRE